MFGKVIGNSASIEQVNIFYTLKIMKSPAQKNNLNVFSVLYMIWLTGCFMTQLLLISPAPTGSTSNTILQPYWKLFSKRHKVPAFARALSAGIVLVTSVTTMDTPGRRLGGRRRELNKQKGPQFPTMVFFKLLTLYRLLQSWKEMCTLGPHGLVPAPWSQCLLLAFLPLFVFPIVAF